MFGCSCPVDWCVTSLVQGSVRVAMAVYYAAQHATPHSTAQYPLPHCMFIMNKRVNENIISQSV